MTPGTEHTIRTEPARNRWRAYFAGHVIADSDNALILREGALPEVVYFPREAVAMEYFSHTDHRTHCPHKGDADYYTLMMDGEWAENGAWTYESPYSGAGDIAGWIAFDREKIEVYEVDDAVVNPHHEDRAFRDRDVDEIVKHTDSGGGASQREHWETNVEGPRPDGGLR